MKINKNIILYSLPIIITLGVIIALILFRVETQETTIYQDEGYVDLQDGATINILPGEGQVTDPVIDTVPSIQQTELIEYERTLNEIRFENIDAEFQALDAIVN